MKRLQIALEFMIIFSFVLVLFLFLFVLIASQRAQILNGQIFSQEQLIGQGVAGQMDRALQAGNGYSAVVPLVGSIGTLAYQLIITKNGAIIINASVGKQTMQAVTYSSVKSVLSSSSYLQSGTAYYNLPVANGTMVIQNSFGTICIDYSCPTAANTAANVSMSTQLVHAANFDGASSVVSVGINGLPLGNNKRSMFGWINLANINTGYTIMEYGTAGSSQHNQQSVLIVTPPGYLEFEAFSANDFTSSIPVTLNAWHFVGYTYDGTTATIYCDGVSQSASVGPLNTVSSGSAELGYANYEYGWFFPGMMANFQVYNASLSASSVAKLYQEGIIGAPVLPSNVVGWWPLNGDVRDYSGNGNDGFYWAPSLFTTVAQLSAKVTNSAGLAVANDLVGFSSTFGNFSTRPSYSNFTNANGIATAFLNQPVTNGQTLVKAYALNGNLTLATNVIGWIPLGDGQGNVISTFSGNVPGSGNGNGAMHGEAFWSDPNYVMSIDGASNSSISIPSGSFSLSGFAFTLSAWVYVKNVTANPASASEGIIWDNNNGIGMSVAPSGSGFGVKPWANGVASVWGSYSLNAWHQIVVVYPTAGSTTRSVYVDGQFVGTESDGTVPSSLPVYLGGHSNYIKAPSMLMNNAQVYLSALSPAQILQMYQSGLSGLPSTSVVGWWPLDGDAIDYTGNGYNGTIYGNINFVSTSQIPISNGNATRILAGSFNPATNSIIATNANVGDNINNLTVVAWVNSYSGGNNLMFASKDNLASLRSWNFGMNTVNSFGTYLWTTTGVANVMSPASLLPNQWNQVAFVYNGTYLALYQNGVFSAKTPKSGTILSNPSVPIAIGGSEVSSNSFNGMISNVQMYNNSLSAGQLQQLYKRGMSGTPVMGANLIGWWPLDGNANDYGPAGNNGTAVNVIFVPQVSLQPSLLSSMGGYGVNFNGQTSYIQSPFISAATFTVSFWMYKGAYSSSCEGVIGKPNTVSNLASTFVIYSPTQNGCTAGSEQGTPLTLKYVDAGGVGHDSISTSANVPALVWTHVAITFNSVSGNINWYVNGLNTKTYTAAPAFGTDVYPLNLGYGDSFFNGSIADVRVYNIDLSSSQVKQLYQGSVPTSATVTVPLGWFP